MSVNVLNQFHLAMQSFGLHCNEPIIPDGKPHRFPIEGDKASSKNGWYIFHLDNLPAGSFGCFKREIHENWCIKKQDELTEAEQQLYQKRIAEARLKREKALAVAQANAKVKAQHRWENAIAVNPAHPYLVKKGIKPLGIKQEEDKLLIPIVDINGNLHSLQVIDSVGNKRFLKDGATKGYFFSIGEPTEAIYLAEGYATSATIHAVTGSRVIVAFNANNLVNIAKVIRSQNLTNKLVICADNDQWTITNPGLGRAREAAKATGAALLYPDFSHLDTTSKPTDFNDLMQLAGKEEVKRQLAISIHKDEDNIRQLAMLSELDYQRQRKSNAKELNISVTILDKLVKQQREESKSKDDNIFPAIKPWDEPVDLAYLLDELSQTIDQLLVFQSKHEPHAIALWIVHTYCIEQAKVSPILNITSPEKRCGKSTLLDVLQLLVSRPLIASNITPAAIFRSIEKWSPTLIIDEADTFMKDNEELRGVINSGHRRELAYVIRCVGDKHEPVRFCTWCPKVIAGIGHLADTIEDRSIVIQLRRKLPHEKREPLTDEAKAKLSILARKCIRFALDTTQLLSASQIEAPLELNDRAADNWKPLFTLAKLAGKGWVTHAQIAAIHLSGSKKEIVSLSVELLQDIKTILDETKLNRISTTELLNKLCEDSEAPWATYNRGKPMAARQLANRLKEFNVISGTIRLSAIETKKGYLTEDFHDAFARYLPKAGENASQA